jgi:uncharacterized protein (DUF2235 family)
MASKPKNIVICLDGTGNQIEENLSNVLKLYRVLEKTDEQLVYYDQGVGTLGHKYTWGLLRQKLLNLLGLAFGRGLEANVIAAYEFIVKHHQNHKIGGKTRGDNIYIFGYSRGAHTARVLAGMLYEIGILKPEQVHLSGAAFTAYKQSKQPIDKNNLSEEPEYEGEGANFRRVANTKIATIKFIGLWDTVSSVFIPNPKGIFPPFTRSHLPHTTINPAVATLRHAMAIDERRRMFRVDHWPTGQVYKPNIYSQGEPEEQDAKEVWFAGVHGDVGGGHKRAESGLSQFPLIWMLEEGQKSDLKIFKRMADYVTGVKPWTKNTGYLYPEPDVKAKLHNSMTLAWKFLEIIPKFVKRREWPKRKSLLGFYIPWGEPRFISDDALIDESVSERLENVESYRPVNLPRGG